jgi:hypothetical protein
MFLVARQDHFESVELIKVFSDGARGEHYAEGEAIILYDQPLRAGGKEALWSSVRLAYSASPSNP